MLSGAGLVRENRGVEHGSDVTPCAVKRAGELKLDVVDRDGEPHRPIRAERERRRKRAGEAALGIALRAQYRQRAAQRLMPGDGEAVELGAVVIGDEAGGLLKVHG